MSVKSSPRRPVRLGLATAAVASGVVLALMAGYQRKVEAPPPEICPVRAITVQALAAGSTVTLTGTVQAETEINQSFRIDGRLIERTVDVGDSVKPGQLIARLDPQNEESSLQDRRGARMPLPSLRTWPRQVLPTLLLRPPRRIPN